MTNQVAKALGFAALMQHSVKQSQACLQISKMLQAQEKIEEANVVLMQALKVARAIDEYGWNRTDI
jgi:hypothetical protein